MEIGKWVKLSSAYLTPGGTPVYVCGKCGGGDHCMGLNTLSGRSFAITAGA